MQGNTRHVEANPHLSSSHRYDLYSEVLYFRSNDEASLKIEALALISPHFPSKRGLCDNDFPRRTITPRPHPPVTRRRYRRRFMHLGVIISMLLSRTLRRRTSTIRCRGDTTKRSRQKMMSNQNINTLNYLEQDYATPVTVASSEWNAKCRRV